MGNLILVYVAEHNNNADDWKGQALSERNFAELERHHIFPKNYIIKMVNNDDTTFADSDEEGEELFINMAANITFIDRYINESISDDSPEEYIPQYRDSAMRHFIPENSELWKFEHYDDFLAERTKLIYKNIQSRYPRIFKELEDAENNLPAIHIKRKYGVRSQPTQEDISVGKTKQVGEKKKTRADHFVSKSLALIQLYEQLETEVQEKFPEIKIDYSKKYVTFYYNDQLTGRVRIQKNDIKLKMPLLPTEAGVPNYSTKKGYPGGGYFYISDEAKLNSAIFLFERAIEKVSKS